MHTSLTALFRKLNTHFWVITRWKTATAMGHTPMHVLFAILHTSFGLDLRTRKTYIFRVETNSITSI
jgi:hypothetical protein